MRDNTVEKLFSLFTSSDCAVAIAGDLAEEREQRGWIWFWLHVARVMLALWRSAATEAPLHVLALVLAGLALLAAPAFGGVAAVFSFRSGWIRRWVGSRSRSSGGVERSGLVPLWSPSRRVAA
jgi:hypothetical protein